uniref:Putative LOV domain-containing protein n=1 Tax=Oenothera gaura TaxID=260689 RepID=A0A126X0K3_9MYRT|nr:putative LOV domain-containing protein [Oenothera gaura]
MEKKSPLPRDSRGSLEVFNPSVYQTRPTNPPFRPQPTWPAQSWTDQRPSQEPEPEPQLEPVSVHPAQSSRVNEITTSWMALKDSPPPAVAVDAGKPPSEVGAAHQRAAEWGLVLKTDTQTGKPQGVTTRTSGDEPKAGTSRRNSNNSCRSSGDQSDGEGKERGFPRVSEDLRDALSAFQQTFVVSDASKPDYPIMYASAGFFKMTGYTSKEVIGRNCRFMQGADTDPEDVSKIREALQEGKSYCGRLLNYKKDGTPFWNLLTISPIKDDEGKVLKFIGMQVEVSKHTEGFKEKTMRPNGLPESLIRYDARQKDMATSSVSELMEAMTKKPRSRSESTRPVMRKSREEKVADGSGMRRKSDTIVGTTATRMSMQRINEVPEKKPKKSTRRSFMRLKRKSESSIDSYDMGTADFDDEDDDTFRDSDDDERPDSVDDVMRQKTMRKGIDLATTLERIEKNFVITDPRLPDNPIIFASDSFLELTEYSREEILGRNCRFLQGPETDPATVRKIREAIDNQSEVTVQLINYTKSGKKFWNLFHLQPMRDQKGEVQYFIGVQLDGSEHVDPLQNSIPVDTATEGEVLVSCRGIHNRAEPTLVSQTDFNS